MTCWLCVGGSLGSHTVLVQSHAPGQAGETITATVAEDTGGHETEVSMPGATRVAGADDSVEGETTTEVQAGLTADEGEGFYNSSVHPTDCLSDLWFAVGLAAHIQANGTEVMIAQGVTEESTITTG